jgi:cob(I)alamin adenosyltransferase
MYSSHLKPLKNFILPGGSRSSSVAHLARTICRRAERVLVLLFEQGNEFDPLVIQYVNRLSDYFFVLARYLNHHLGIEEPIWGRKIQ